MRAFPGALVWLAKVADTDNSRGSKVKQRRLGEHKGLLGSVNIFPANIHRKQDQARSSSYPRQGQWRRSSSGLRPTPTPPRQLQDHRELKVFGSPLPSPYSCLQAREWRSPVPGKAQVRNRMAFVYWVRLNNLSWRLLTSSRGLRLSLCTAAPTHLLLLGFLPPAPG